MTAACRVAGLVATAASLATVSLWACLAPARADELVTFDSIAARRHQTPFAQARGEVVPLVPASQIRGYLARPAGAGPFAGIVLLPGCDGLTPARRTAAQGIAEWGYVVLAVDGFTTRGIGDACKPSPGRPHFVADIEDALGALVHLSRLGYVDAKRLAVVGFAHGGSAALYLASNRLPQVEGEVPRPRAVVGFYPSCGSAARRLAIPTLVLIGDRDDWMSSSWCDELVQRLAPDSAELKLAVLPGTAHAFDVPDADRPSFGHRLRHDAEATRHAMAETRAFLSRHLGGK